MNKMKTLSDIIEYKKEEVNIKKKLLTLTQIKEESSNYNPTRPFLKQIESNKSKISIISEIKKASPSKGVIRSDFNPVEIGQIYERNGARCLSILTDKKFFHGDDKFIKAVKSKVSLPVLRKDFIIDEWQIEESRYLGADCILLILSCLSFDQAKEYEEYAFSLGMNVIVEVHDLQELELANKLKAKLIGINNRNLKTMDVNINTSMYLINYNAKIINGIDHSKNLIESVKKLVLISKKLNKRKPSIAVILIGEAFMKENNIAKMFKNLKAIDV